MAAIDIRTFARLRLNSDGGYWRAALTQ